MKNFLVKPSKEAVLTKTWRHYLIDKCLCSNPKEITQIIFNAFLKILQLKINVLINQSPSSSRNHLVNTININIQRLSFRKLFFYFLNLLPQIIKDGNSLYIKVADVIPKFTFLGKNLDEALNLQKEHEDLLLNIQVDGVVDLWKTFTENYMLASSL